MAGGIYNLEKTGQAIKDLLNKTDNLPNRAEYNEDLGKKQNVIDDGNKLDADLVDDSGSTHQFVTSAEKTDIADNTQVRHNHDNKSILDNITAPYTTEEKTKLNDIQKVSGTDDDTNWTSITIGNKTRSIPSGSGGGMTNPMTARGDIIYGGENGTPTRLGIGTSGQVLKVKNDGGLEWGTGTSVTIDSEINSNSINPVQNKVIYQALDSKQDVIDINHKLSADLIEDGSTNKVFTSSEQTKLSGIQTGAEVNVIEEIQVNGVTVPPVGKMVGIEVPSQVQADWTETDTTAKSYIKNKQTIPTALGQLSDDSAHRFVSDTDISKWDNKQNALSPAQLDAVNSGINSGYFTAFKNVELACYTHTLKLVFNGYESESPVSSPLRVKSSIYFRWPSSIKTIISAAQMLSDLSNYEGPCNGIVEVTASGSSASRYNLIAIQPYVASSTSGLQLFYDDLENFTPSSIKIKLTDSAVTSILIDGENVPLTPPQLSAPVVNKTSPTEDGRKLMIRNNNNVPVVANITLTSEATGHDESITLNIGANSSDTSISWTTYNSEDVEELIYSKAVIYFTNTYYTQSNSTTYLGSMDLDVPGLSTSGTQVVISNGNDVDVVAHITKYDAATGTPTTTTITINAYDDDSSIQYKADTPFEALILSKIEVYFSRDGYHDSTMVQKEFSL